MEMDCRYRYSFSSWHWNYNSIYQKAEKLISSFHGSDTVKGAAVFGTVVIRKSSIKNDS